MLAEILLLLLAGLAWQDDEPVISDLEFLEYLGSWEDSDRDWLLMDGVMNQAEEEETPANAEIEPIAAEEPEESGEDDDDS